MKKSELNQLIKEEIKKALKETTALMKNASKETKARDIEQSDREYIATRQQRDKIAKSLFNKSYKELSEPQKNKVNNQSSLKETSIPKNALMTALEKAGIEVEDDMNVELKGPKGKTKIVTVNPDGKVTMDEGIKDKLVIAATCLVLASGLVSCTKPNDSDLRPNNTQTELPSDTSSENNPRQETPIQGKYAFTGGCNNWNNMFLKITDDTIYVLQRVPEIWSSVPQYRVVDGVGFLVTYESKLDNLTRTGKNTFEFNMNIKENGVPVTAFTAFEIDDDNNTGSINTFGKATSGQIKRIYSFN